MTDLTAEVRISHPDAVSIMRFLSEQHAELEIDPGRPGVWTFRTPYGAIDAAQDASGLSIRVSAPDETNLAYMKMGIANRAALLLGEAVELRWSGDRAAAGAPAFFRELTVLTSRRLTPHMQRVRFAGSDLARLADGGLHVRLLFPPAGRTPVWPRVAASGALIWPQGEDALATRLYTIRSIDAAAGWIEIDFVLHHGHGAPGMAFAGNAVAGDVIGMLGPSGEELLRASHLVLFADDAAIPAVARLLAGMPSDAKADVFLEIDGPADEQRLEATGDARVVWLHRAGEAAGTTQLLLEAAEAFDPAQLAPDAFVWAGCEHATARAIRQHVRSAWKMPRDRHLVAAYWRLDLARADEEIMPD